MHYPNPLERYSNKHMTSDRFQARDIETVIGKDFNLGFRTKPKGYGKKLRLQHLREKHSSAPLLGIGDYVARISRLNYHATVHEDKVVTD